MTALEKYIWERLYNPDFNYGEFATIRNQAGLNSFKISVKEYEVTLQHERLVRLNRIAIGPPPFFPSRRMCHPPLSSIRIANPIENK